MSRQGEKVTVMTILSRRILYHESLEKSFGKALQDSAKLLEEDKGDIPDVAISRELFTETA